MLTKDIVQYANDEMGLEMNDVTAMRLFNRYPALKSLFVRLHDADKADDEVQRFLKVLDGGRSERMEG